MKRTCKIYTLTSLIMILSMMYGNAACDCYVPKANSITVSCATAGAMYDSSGTWASCAGSPYLTWVKFHDSNVDVEVCTCAFIPDPSNPLPGLFENCTNASQLYLTNITKHTQGCHGTFGIMTTATDTVGMQISCIAGRDWLGSCNPII